jgi:hypothetical protein
MDIADMADNAIEETLERSIAAARMAGGEFKDGVSGDCDLCGYWSSRLVEGECPPCRDKYKRNREILGKT